jgi:Putative Ig domain
VSDDAGVHVGDGYVDITYGMTDPVSFSSATPPGGLVGQPYAYQFQANGWPVPQYSLIGTAPAGLTFNQRTGYLSGSPTTAGVYSFKLAADNGEPSAVSR